MYELSEIPPWSARTVSGSYRLGAVAHGIAYLRSISVDGCGAQYLYFYDSGGAAQGGAFLPET